MEAALAAGVERIVYTSSVATLRAADAATVVDETAPLAEHEAVGRLQAQQGRRRAAGGAHGGERGCRW